MIAFIDDHRGAHGVEPICKVLPIAPSAQSRAHVRSLLLALGKFALLRKTNSMLRAEMAVADMSDGVLRVRMADRVSIDHFLDELDAQKLTRLERSVRAHGKDTEGASERAKRIESEMERLVRPWVTGQGMMVGYDASEEVETYFIELFRKTADDWRSQSGIHPDTQIGATNGAVLAATTLFLGSFYAKHIRFVDIGKRLNPSTNYAMALTIWRSPDDLAIDLANATGLRSTSIRGAIDALTVSKEHAEFFAVEEKPYIPMLLRFGDHHYVSPISNIFRNALEGVRLIGGYYSPEFEQALIVHREGWMIEELSHLFLGTRFHRAQKATRIRRAGKTLTDIDWAVLDVSTGELALFQLKWQDFATSHVRKQMSRAHNFTAQVNKWAETVSGWIYEFGVETLLRSMHFPIPKAKPVKVFLFAIGRQRARFASYGVESQSTSIALSTWPQFVRIRQEIGSAAETIGDLHRRLHVEAAYPAPNTPIPYEVTVQGQRIVFEDIWKGFPNEDD